MDVKSTLEKQKKRRETEIAVRRSERNPFLKFKPRSRSEIETEFERLELLIEAIEAESAQLEKKIVCSLLSFAGTESKGLVVRWYNWALKCHEDEELTLWLQLLAESLGKIERKKLAGGRAVNHLRSLKNKIEPKLLALFPVDNAELNDQRKSKGGRKAKYPPEVAKDCMDIVNDFKQQNSRQRCSDTDIGNHALKCIEVVPEAITEKIADLNDVSAQELGKIIREAARCPIG